MTLIKTSILSFIATAIKIIAGLVINKAVALYIGPTGLALIGQFQNFSQLAMTAAQGGINTGITKYTAEYGKNSDKIPIFFSTASKISLFSSILIGFGIAIFSSQASVFFLKSTDHQYIFFIFGFTIILFVINNLLLSILNGLKEIKIWASINIIQSIYSLVFTSILIVFLGIDGILIALVTNQSVTLIIVIWMLRKHPIINFKNFKQELDKAEAKKLAGFAIMSISSTVAVALSHLTIRNHIGTTLDWEQAGYWQAIWYISTMYLMIVTTTLSIYYLPRLSEINDKTELRKELWEGYKVIMPIVVFMSITIFVLKDSIIFILFTKEFLPMKELFFWQLTGDVIKIASWLLAYIMLAKAMTKFFVLTEIGFSLTFILLSIFLVNQYGLIGMSYSFAINYSLYFIALLAITKKELY